MSNLLATSNGQPIVQIDYDENTDKYVGHPYIIVDGERRDLMVGDVINVAMSSDEAFGYPQYRKVTISGFNKSSLHGYSKGRYTHLTADKKRVNYSKIAEGADENSRSSWNGTLGDPVIFVKTAAQAKADRAEREAQAKIEADQRRYEIEARNRAYVGYQRDQETKAAMDQAKVDATQALLAKYATELSALTATMQADAVAKVNAEHPEVPNQYVVVTSLDPYYAARQSYAFDTEDEALAFVDGLEDIYFEDDENDGVTVVGPVTL